MPSADVIFYDTVGMPYTGMTPYEMGLGGSELSVIQVAEGLAICGLVVVVLNNTIGSKCINGVLYRHHSDQYRSGMTWTCKALVVQRHSRRPYFIKCDRLFYAMHDKRLPVSEMDYLNEYVFPDNGTLIAVSNWQRNLFPESWPAKVIPNILPAEVYDTTYQQEPGKFVYASAASRGLRESLGMWRSIRGITNYGELHACWPEYDTANLGGRIPNTHLMGSLNLPDLIRMIGTAEGIFYVNRDPETFCIVAAIAEALGVRVHVLGMYGLGALPETVGGQFLTTSRATFVDQFVLAKDQPALRGLTSTHDYCHTTIIPMWLEALGL